MTELPLAPDTEPVKRSKPDWLRVKLPIGESYKHVRNLVDTHKLHTICESGNCPNMGECWGAGTATFMICDWFRQLILPASLLLWICILHFYDADQRQKQWEQRC